MKILNLAKKIEGLQTVSTISKTLNISERTAINYVSLLRKAGYLRETIYGAKKIRMYKISLLKRKMIGNPGFYEVLDKNSRVGVYSPYEEDRIYGKKLSIEETIVRAVKTRKFRIILSSLGLFSKVRDWKKLNYYAHKEGLGRNIGALYDVARKVIKVRKIDKRVKNSLLKSKVKSKFIIPLIKSKDLKDIEDEWNVYIPFNKSDLEVYKE